MDNLIVQITTLITTYNEKQYNCYTNQELLKKKIVNIIEESQSGVINRCLECEIDMGECNPRQLCGKTYCIFNK